MELNLKVNGTLMDKITKKGQLIETIKPYCERFEKAEYPKSDLIITVERTNNR